MPPQPEYVLIRDKARELVYLTKELLERDRPGLVCMLTYIAKILLYRALNLRNATRLWDESLNIDDLVSIVLNRDSREEALRCIDEVSELLREVDGVFMERREEECECWGE